METRRAQIYSAAGGPLSRRGYAATSVRNVARERDLQGGRLYAHIASKEDGRPRAPHCRARLHRWRNGRSQPARAAAPSAGACPSCDSRKALLENRFGPTPSRSIYYGNPCRQPFEAFKAV